MPDPVAILGGTGKEGRGLAARWSRVGRPVVIGSRDPDRARSVAAEVAELSGGDVSGATNAGACEAAETVVLATPFEGLDATASALVDQLRDTLVVGAGMPLQV